LAKRMVAVSLAAMLLVSTSALWVGPRAAPPMHLLRSVAVTAGARLSSPPRCCDSVDVEKVSAAGVPPEKLAQAWRGQEQAETLGTLLKGCSIYIVGLGSRKTAIGRVLSRRLPRYRVYDVGSLMCTTYRSLAGGEEALSLQQLVSKEPLADVEQLANAVLRELQQYSRSVFVTWDGAVTSSDYMVMQQGLVVHLDLSTKSEEVALPTDGAEGVMDAWQDGHTRADVTVRIEEGTVADDAALKVIDALIAFIKDNPAKSGEWKAKADAELEKQAE